MRPLVLAVALVASVAPAPARADFRLGLTRLDGFERLPPPTHVEVPRLQLGLGDARVDDGGGAGRTSVDPVIALVLGIFPGFGLGHYLAGSPQWTNWLIIDVILLVAAVAVSAADVGVLTALAWVAVVVERVFEGIDAFRKAGGRMAAARRGDALAAGSSAPPPRDETPWGGAPSTPKMVFARF